MTEGACIKGVCSGVGEKLWSKPLGPKSSAFLDVAKLPGGQFVAVGWTSAQTKGGNDGRVVAFDALGAQQWAQTHGSKGNDVYRSVAVGKQGLALAGEHKPGSFMLAWLTLAGFDGTAKVTVSWTGELQSKLHEVAANGEGWIGVGRTIGWGAKAKSYGLVVGVAGNGKKQWVSQLGGGKAELFDVVPSAGGGFVTVGDATPTSSIVAGLGADGLARWQRTIGATVQLRRVVEQTDGDLLVGGNYNGVLSKMMVARLNAQGHMRWWRAVPVPAGMSAAKLGGLGIIEGPHAKGAYRKIVVLGVAKPLGADLIISHLDWQGRFERRLVMDDIVKAGWHDTAGGLLPMDDGGVLAVGSTRDKEKFGTEQRATVTRAGPWLDRTCKNAGKCAVLPPSACTDTNDCTLDECDRAKGECVLKDRDGTSFTCSDDDPCTRATTCSFGKCDTGGADVLWASEKISEGAKVYLTVLARGHFDEFLAASYRNLKATWKPQAWIGRYRSMAKSAGAIGGTVYDKSFGYDTRIYDAVVRLDGAVLTTGTRDGKLLIARHKPGIADLGTKTNVVVGQVDSTSGQALAALRTGGVWSVGYSGASKQVRGHAVLVTGADKVAVDKVLTPAGQAHGKLRDAIGLTSGDVIAVGDAGGGGIEATGWAIRVNTGGTVTHNITEVPVVNGVKNHGYWSTAQEVVGGLLAGGRSGKTVWLVRLDEALKFAWQKHWKLSVFNTQAIVDIEPIGGGLYGVLSQARVGPTGMMLHHVTVDGERRMQRFLTPAGVTDDPVGLLWYQGGLLIGATRTNGSTPKALILRTDVYGNASCTEAGVCLGHSAGTCDDGKACTSGSCDKQKGCDFTPINDCL